MNSFHNISIIYSSTWNQLTFYKFLLQFQSFSSKSGPLSSVHQPKLPLFTKAPWSACDWNCYPKTCFFVEPLGVDGGVNPLGVVFFFISSFKKALILHINLHLSLKQERMTLMQFEQQTYWILEISATFQVIASTPTCRPTSLNPCPV